MTNPEKPNVIVFFTDQQRWDTTGAGGSTFDITPNFDRMASQGTHLSHSFTCQPVCGPARACLQTGKYATQTGVWRNGIALGPNQKTLAQYFSDAGYQTGYIGKWHLADTGGGRVEAAQRGGYDFWLAANCLEATSDAYDCIVYDNAQNQVKLPGYRVDALTDAAIRYMDEKQNDPFFLFLSFLEPHHQNHRDDYPAPNGYAAQYARYPLPPDLTALGGNAVQNWGGYLGMIKRLDEALGRILDALQSLNLRENTIVLFTSDHGCHFKTRNDEYKRSCHDASLRVPTALCGPGFDGGGRVSELVSLVDLPPTLLDAAHLPVPESMAGRSVLPLLRGDAEDWPDSIWAQISESQVGRCVRTKRWKYSVCAPGKNGYKESGSEAYDEAFLYDLLADPFELTNLIGFASHEKVKAVLREKLMRRMENAGETAPIIVPAPISHKAGQRRVSDAEAQA